MRRVDFHHITPCSGVWVLSLGFDDVLAASRRIAGRVKRTPVVTSEALDALSANALFLKCENLQHSGAFKFRGATNAVSLLTEEEAIRGVCTHSSGNHAAALALAARQRDIPAYVVMPSDAPEMKREAVLDYGAEVFDCEPLLAARQVMSEQVIERTGAAFIHPYDDANVIAGQGTAALELIEEVPDLDMIIAPIGGGGLMSGTCIAARALDSRIRLFGAEPAGADDAARSLKEGELIPQENPDTICDGLLTSLGELTWPILSTHLDDVITVSDEQVVEAMRLLFELTGMIVEPSGAIPLAAAMSGDLPPSSRNGRIGLILSGGNIAIEDLPFDVPSQ